MEANIDKIARKFPSASPANLFVFVLVLSVFLGVGAGYLLASNSQNGQATSQIIQTESNKTAQTDKRTFRDFAQGVIEKKATPKNPNEYVEGTHILKRDGALPVALTSSVVDLIQYEGKKVKVYGETQKAIREGWLMDVGMVEVQN